MCISEEMVNQETIFLMENKKEYSFFFFLLESQ